MKEHLSRYLENFVVPTVEDYNRNPSSVRHAFLACLVIWHAADRMAYPDDKKLGNIQKDWIRDCFEFRLIDMVANQFKHVERRDKREAHNPNIPKDAIHLVHALGLDETAETLELHSLYFVVRDAVSFLKRQAQGGK